MLVAMTVLSYTLPVVGLLCAMYVRRRCGAVINLILAVLMLLFNLFHLSELFYSFAPRTVVHPSHDSAGQCPAAGGFPEVVACGGISMIPGPPLGRFAFHLRNGYLCREEKRFGNERFCSHRFRNGQRPTHERLLGRRGGGPRRGDPGYVLQPDPSAPELYTAALRPPSTA